VSEVEVEVEVDPQYEQPSSYRRARSRVTVFKAVGPIRATVILVIRKSGVRTAAVRVQFRVGRYIDRAMRGYEGMRSRMPSWYEYRAPLLTLDLLTYRPLHSESTTIFPYALRPQSRSEALRRGG
jgi:hypothetical protein